MLQAPPVSDSMALRGRPGRGTCSEFYGSNNKCTPFEVAHPTLAVCIGMQALLAASSRGTLSMLLLPIHGLFLQALGVCLTEKWHCMGAYVPIFKAHPDLAPNLHCLSKHEILPTAASLLPVANEEEGAPGTSGGHGFCSSAQLLPDDERVRRRGLIPVVVLLHFKWCQNPK